MAVMKSNDLVAKAIDIAKNYKTLYVMGCFGAPLNAANKKRYTANHSYNKKKSRTDMINKATYDTFGFDCVCLIKGILWGWNGDAGRVYGGASYACNCVPDIGADNMITKCSGVSTNFNGIVPGEVVWTKGHIGIYIGDGLAVECTPKWKNCVQITAVGNIGKKSGYNARNWKKHGKLPWIEYVASTVVEKKGYKGKFPTLPLFRGCLRRGNKGTNVKHLQKFLNWYGNYKLDVDGSYGSLTEGAVRSYQKAEKLVVDGLFGKASLKRAKEVKK